ncbi:hypothetical protein HDU67_004212 [Dinochytrium kinnereticum]|nr:hypothetical protein HDU67_004212 [Dinochytrium kinnereticum]
MTASVHYELCEVPTNGIEDHMDLGTTATVDPHIPKTYHGLFYMKGNPMPDEVCSFANGQYDEETRSYSFPVYGPRIWTWDNTIFGRWLYSLVKATRLHYHLTYDSTSDEILVTPVMHLDKLSSWLRKVEIPKVVVEFRISPSEGDVDAFVRRSWLFGWKLLDYEFLRIVDGEGRRTRKYETTYLSMINYGHARQGDTVPLGFSWFTHLKETQLVAIPVEDEKAE